MGNSWNTFDAGAHDPRTPMRVHLFCSRNKDNVGVAGFTQRRRGFIALDSDAMSVERRFERFVADGAYGEQSRWYASVNARDPLAVRKRLACKLIMDDACDLARIESEAVSIAAGRECAAERRWLFDVDDPDRACLARFLSDLKTMGGFAEGAVETYATPHGFAVVAPHGFDTRALLDPETGWGRTVTLKRDDMLIRAWDTNAFGND